jgi:hypothetical protein
MIEEKHNEIQEEKSIESKEEKAIEIKEENKAEQKPMLETEWICDFCNLTNFIIYDDLTTSICCNPDCYRKNLVVFDLLKAY